MQLGYNRTMKILFAPYIKDSKADWSYWLTENLITLFTSNGENCAVSSIYEGIFHHAALYPEGEKNIPLSLFHGGRSYEEYLYRIGAIDRKYLEDDVSCMCEAMDKFKPNLVIVMDRPSAIIAARLKNVPCFVIVHSFMYKSAKFPTKVLHNFNAVLSSCGLEQELSLKDFYAKCDRRIGFGSISTDPFLSKDNVERIGMMSVYPARSTTTNRMCMFLSESKRSSSSYRKLIRDSFLGAPYAVHAWYPGAKPETMDNIKILSYMKPEMIPGSIAVIHDGNPYVANRCMALGIPQLIIANHSYMRSDLARMVERCKAGMLIYEDALSMASLYETYRQMLTDDEYYFGCQKIKEEIFELGDLSEFLNIIDSL